MKFHTGSFLLGWASGAATIALESRSRPVLMAFAVAGVKLADSLVTVAATRFEDLEDLVAEAKARARQVTEPHKGSSPTGTPAAEPTEARPQTAH